MSVGALKFIWRVCGTCGIALLAWSFLRIQTDEVTLADCVWELLLAVILMAAAFQAYRKWEAVRPPQAPPPKGIDREKNT